MAIVTMLQQQFDHYQREGAIRWRYEPVAERRPYFVTPVTEGVSVEEMALNRFEASAFLSGLVTGIAHAKRHAAAAAADEADTGWCEWCEEAESPVYLAHEGHDPECPFDDTPRPPLKVGQQITVVARFPWTERSHGDREHVIMQRAEVTAIDNGHVSWRAVELVTETGRPPESPSAPPETGGFMLDFLPDLIELGLIITEQRGAAS